MNNYRLITKLADNEHTPAIPYTKAYADELNFEADSDQGALDFVEELQDKHDEKYTELGVDIKSTDFEHTPEYLNCVYLIKLDGNGNEISTYVHE